MQQRLQLVGEIERPQHYFLEGDHRCYFWGEYTPWEYTEGKRWDYSDTNRLIANFKKGSFKVLRAERSDLCCQSRLLPSLIEGRRRTARAPSETW